MESQNKVSGQIIHHESGIGIPNLVVEIFDLDPRTYNPDEDLIYVSPGRPLGDDDFEADQDSETNRTSTQGLPADRLGSVITDQDGYFELMYEDEAFQVRTRDKNPSLSGNTVKDEIRPDLFVLVTAPEQSSVELYENVIFRSNWARINAGRNESFLIRLTTSQLNEAKVSVPTNDEENNRTQAKITRYVQNIRAQKEFRVGIRGGREQLDSEDREEREELRNAIKEVILPNRAVLQSLYNFVTDADTIESVQDQVYLRGLDRIDQLIAAGGDNPEPGKGIKVNLFLTDKQKEKLNDFSFTHEGREYFNIREDLIQELLFKAEHDGGLNTVLFSNNPISKFCIEKSRQEKCAKIYTDLESVDNEGQDSTEETNLDDVTGFNQEDIPYYLQRVLFDRDSNMFQGDGLQIAQRPDGESVQASVDSFSLQKGPADATAFYDFHSLQIAFQDVWQQLLDQTLVDLGEKIHYTQEFSGKKGLVTWLRQRTENRTTSYGDAIAAAANSAREDSIVVPVEISAAFDISTLEYDALGIDDKSKLEELAIYINRYEFNARLTTTVSVKRDQGERLIDNVRVNKPFSTNAMLKELQEKLLSKYEFTVFAADKNHHCINFGLLNTFRQKWEPISYQAGRLVKTIPLSPKEERKYSIKTRRQLKTTKKQAIKNNSSIESEVNSTSRAESEIIAKAQEKSNFNMSVGVSYSGFSSKIGLNKDAAKDSTQTKKDFREAVVKAAQEYKEERRLEIETSKTFESEYSESGTIVNPNDELSVTYLFYELQRRYRVSEQLYRVMPVVMVAQEVPCPHQITKAWVIAHDWIINRVLLDDSFRPTLQYIGQKNVGDDFAIRELRKNLRQQRGIVNNLKIEFSKLKQNVENKYSKLQSTISERIDEEHDKRFYKYRWWWWYGYNANGSDTPPDPEMAKALEQAAADDHKHAVEQAKEMAMSVQREIQMLNQLTQQYNDAMQEHWDLITQIRRLITHIKDNILYYMSTVYTQIMGP
ncbi:MAG: hypothetical protein HRU41_41175 [Saprospiraceae bacterium]|nr:hypothetical protein [Saprospiraceae bacterium]